MSVISNTTVISNFAAAERLELLHLLFDKLYITSQVFDEIQAGLLDGYTFYRNINLLIHPFTDKGWLCLTSLTAPDELQTFDGLLAKLHTGEASCLSVALHREWVFLSDDKAARNAAVQAGAAVSGTLGVLLSLVKKKSFSLKEGDALLHRMIEHGYYSPVSSLRDLEILS
jgi:predicted nucleic acid-binding protein